MKIINTIVNEQLPCKINFGCGNNILQDYVNIDINVPPQMNQNAFIFEGTLLNPQVLPNNYFDLIKAQMVFEHIHIDLIPSVIYTMNCLLKKDGEVHVTVPNFSYFARQYTKQFKDGEFTLKHLSLIRECIFQLLDPMLTLDETTSFRGHQSLWTPELADYLFRSEGFNVIHNSSDNEPILTFTAIAQNDFSVSLEVL